MKLSKRADPGSITRHDAEILCRVNALWKDFTTKKDMLKVQLNITMHANTLNKTVKPTPLYPSERWTSSNREEQGLIMRQRTM